MQYASMQYVSMQYANANMQYASMQYVNIQHAMTKHTFTNICISLSGGGGHPNHPSYVHDNCFDLIKKCCTKPLQIYHGLQAIQIMNSLQA